MTKTLIIDSSHLLYQAIYSGMPELEYGLQKTHIIFSFISKILALANRFQTNRFIFCFDHKLNKRKKVYPQYKEKRNKKDKTEEEREMFGMAFEQLNELRESVLPSLGFRNVFQKAGFESDDIMASLVMNNVGDYVLISNDEDMWQVLDYCSVYNSKTDKVYTKKDFIEEYEIGPKQWVDVKAVGGCKSDEVEGAGGGFKVKSALSFVKGELPKHHKVHAEFTSEEGKAVIARNLKLVKLPYEGTGIFELREESFRSVDFIEMVGKYGFRSFMNGNKSGLTKWNEIFVGEN